LTPDHVDQPANDTPTERKEDNMLSHHPEVSRLHHQEHVQRLAEDAQQPMQHPRLPSLRLAEKLSGLSALTHTALNARHRRLRTRP
jgi:hypothetical protein